MTTTAIGASRVSSERRSGSEFVQSNECEEVWYTKQVRRAGGSVEVGGDDPLFGVGGAS